MTETDLDLFDGRTLHICDTDGADARVAVFSHHGTPNIGEPPEPLLSYAAERGIRWVSYDRPGYGGSTPNPGRDVASAAADIASIADALGIDQFAVMGHSGGGTHGLACAAPRLVRPPVLVLHGGRDRVVPSSHRERLARHSRSAELWLRPDDGHISILSSGEAALDWLRACTDRS